MDLMEDMLVQAGTVSPVHLIVRLSRLGEVYEYN